MFLRVTVGLHLKRGMKQMIKFFSSKKDYDEKTSQNRVLFFACFGQITAISFFFSLFRMQSNIKNIQYAECFFPRQEVHGVHRYVNLFNTTSQMKSGSIVKDSLASPQKEPPNNLKLVRSWRVFVPDIKYCYEDYNVLLFESGDFSTKNEKKGKSPVFSTQIFVTLCLNTTISGGVLLSVDFVTLDQSVENPAGENYV
jgi:hypothetical protein